ncbi:hypothetical protein OKW42_001310 [Paraburkholderia sp. WC7.3d]
MKTLDATSRGGGVVAVVVVSAALSGCFLVDATRAERLHAA